MNRISSGSFFSSAWGFINADPGIVRPAGPDRRFPLLVLHPPLTVTQVTEEAGTSDAPGPGILYRVDLTEVANVDRANVDMKFDIADVPGNSTTYTMEPAFQVIKVLPSGRRCASVS